MNQVYVSAVVKSYIHTQTHSHLQHRTHYLSRDGGDDGRGGTWWGCPTDPVTARRIMCSSRGTQGLFPDWRRRPSAALYLPHAVPHSPTTPTGPAARDPTRFRVNLFQGKCFNQ
jgi:hypothetical protein